MRIFALILLLVVSLAACARHPEFKRGDGGYTAKETPLAGIVLIQLRLPPGMSPEITADYLARAAGEECAARHFDYFDFAPSRKGDGRAFCYSQPEAPQLGVVLDPKAFPELRVEDMGRGSPLHPGDVILKVGGHSVRDEAELKEAVYLAGKRGDKHISVSLERSQIPFVMDCALENTSTQISGPETLEKLRAKFK